MAGGAALEKYGAFAIAASIETRRSEPGPNRGPRGHGAKRGGVKPEAAGKLPRRKPRHEPGHGPQQPGALDPGLPGQGLKKWGQENAPDPRDRFIPNPRS